MTPIFFQVDVKCHRGIEQCGDQDQLRDGEHGGERADGQGRGGHYEHGVEDVVAGDDTRSVARVAPRLLCKFFLVSLLQTILCPSFPHLFEHVFLCQSMIGKFFAPPFLSGLPVKGPGGVNKNPIPAPDVARPLKDVRMHTGIKHSPARIMEGGYPLNASPPYILWFLSTICRYGNGDVLTACSTRR